jgi:hypothetical protein
MKPNQSSQSNQVFQFEADQDEIIEELFAFSSGNDIPENDFDQFSGENEFFGFYHIHEIFGMHYVGVFDLLKMNDF